MAQSPDGPMQVATQVQGALEVRSQFDHMAPVQKLGCEQALPEQAMAHRGHTANKLNCVLSFYEADLLPAWEQCNSPHWCH